jgi:hypothetical protein
MLGSFLLFPFLFSFSRRLSSLPFSCHPFILSTAGGLPPPDYFPYETLTATTLARNSFRTTEQGLGAWLWSFVAGGKKTDKWDIAKWESDPLKVQLSSALQYGTSISFSSFRRDDVQEPFSRRSPLFLAPVSRLTYTVALLRC